jgi:hypothetical protein
MVWLAPQDFVCPEELLEQDDPSELMRQRDWPKREERIRPPLDARAETEWPAQDEAEVLARLSPLLHEPGNFHARERLSLAIERADEAFAGDPSQQGGRLPLEQLCLAPRIAPGLLQLDYLYPAMAPDQACVVGRVVCKRGATEGADTDDQDAHGGILRE